MSTNDGITNNEQYAAACRYQNGFLGHVDPITAFMAGSEWARTHLAGQFEKVEQERDRLATVLATTARQRDDADKRSARPLKPTDAMVARARESLRSDGWTVGEDDTGLRAALAAALTEPPARPEGAEEIEAWLDGMPESIRLDDEHDIPEDDS